MLRFSGSTADCGLDYLLVSVLLSLDTHLRIKSGCTEPEVGIEARVCRLLVDMNPRNISKELLVERLDVLVMSDMRIENGHLAAAYTGAYV